MYAIVRDNTNDTGIKYKFQGTGRKEGMLILLGATEWEENLGFLESSEPFKLSPPRDIYVLSGIVEVWS